MSKCKRCGKREAVVCVHCVDEYGDERRAGRPFGIEHDFQEARPTDPDELVGLYTFTYEQLFDLLTGAEARARQIRAQYGMAPAGAMAQAAEEAIASLDAERVL